MVNSIFCSLAYIWGQDSVIILNFNGLNASLFLQFPIFFWSFLRQKLAEIIIFDETQKREMYQKFKSPLSRTLKKSLKILSFGNSSRDNNDHNSTIVLLPSPDFFWNSPFMAELHKKEQKLELATRVPKTLIWQLSPWKMVAFQWPFQAPNMCGKGDKKQEFFQLQKDKLKIERPSVRSSKIS